MRKQKLLNGFEAGTGGLGCMGFSHAYGASTQDNEAIEIICRAAEAGYELFDTAKVYGTQEDPHCNEVLAGNVCRFRRNKNIQ